ncbi:MAG: hypothetical protein NTX17_08465 [Candidatus Eisenbacteria bacterium]|nr:hypothetical protein [Candidatus Eisenbacteria bacterium]
MRSTRCDSIATGAGVYGENVFVQNKTDLVLKAEGGIGGTITRWVGIPLTGSPNMLIDHNIIAGCVGEGIYGDDYASVSSCSDVWGNSPAKCGGTIPDRTGGRARYAQSCFSVI